MILKDGEQQITFRLSRELHRRFRVAVAASGSSMTHEIVAFLEARYPPASAQGRSKKKTKELDQAVA